eukprot:scaffold1724_cov341-Pavlova_lutheri.AAC.66
MDPTRGWTLEREGWILHEDGRLKGREGWILHEDGRLKGMDGWILHEDGRLKGRDGGNRRGMDADEGRWEVWKEILSGKDRVFVVLHHPCGGLVQACKSNHAPTCRVAVYLHVQNNAWRNRTYREMRCGARMM